MTLNDCAHKLFDVLRKLVKSNQALSRGIGERFETAYLKFLTYIPTDYHPSIIKYFNLAQSLIGCVDFGRMSLILQGQQLLNFKFEFDFQSYLKKMVETKILDDAGKRNLLLSLIDKSQPIFNCITYLINNPSILAENMKIFGEVNDIFNF